MSQPVEEVSGKPHVDTAHSAESMSSQDDPLRDNDANDAITRAERIRRFYGMGGSSTNGSFRDDETASEGGASYDSEFEFNLRSVRSLAALGLGGADLNQKPSYPTLSSIFNISRSNSMKRSLPSNHISSILQVLPDCFSQFADTTPHLADLAPPYRSLWMSLATVESFLAAPPYNNISTTSSPFQHPRATGSEDNSKPDTGALHGPLTLQRVKDLTTLVESLTALLKRHVDVQSLVLIPWINRKANVPLMVQTARDRLYDRLQSLDSQLDQVLAIVEVLDSIHFSGPLETDYIPSTHDDDVLLDNKALGSVGEKVLQRFATTPLVSTVPNLPPSERRLSAHEEEVLSASVVSVENIKNRAGDFDGVDGDIGCDDTQALPLEEALPRVIYSLRKLLSRVTTMTNELCTQSASYLGEEYTSLTTFIEAHFSRTEWESIAPYFWRAWCSSEGSIEPLKDNEPTASPMLVVPIKQPPLQPPLFNLDTPLTPDSPKDDAASGADGAGSLLEETQEDRPDVTGDTVPREDMSSDADSLATQPSADEASSGTVDPVPEGDIPEVRDVHASVAEDTVDIHGTENGTRESDGAGDGMSHRESVDSDVMNSPLNLAIFCKNLQNDDEQMMQEMDELDLDDPEQGSGDSGDNTGKTANYSDPSVKQGDSGRALSSERVLSDGTSVDTAEADVASTGTDKSNRRSRAASLLATIKATFTHQPRPQPDEKASAGEQGENDGSMATASDPQTQSSGDSLSSDKSPIDETVKEPVKKEKTTSIAFPLPPKPKRPPVHPLKATKFDPNRHLKLLVPFFLQASKGHEEDKDWLLRRLPLTIPQRKLCLTEWVLLWEKEKAKNGSGST